MFLCFFSITVKSRTLLQVKDDYVQDDSSITTPKLSVNDSDVYLPQAIELNWNQPEHKEGLTDLAGDLSKGVEDKENVHPEKPMRTEKR